MKLKIIHFFTKFNPFLYSMIGYFTILAEV
jgi:hypothetical protein